MVFVDISRKAKSFGPQKNEGMICMGKIFKRRIMALFLFLFLFSIAFSYTIDVYAFFQTKENKIVSEQGIMWGLGVDAQWHDFTFNAEILETNYVIGDIKLKWPQKVKLFEDTYYPFGESVLTYSIPEFELSVGLQSLNEGLGSEYPLFISSNNTPYPSLKTIFRPFDWLSFQQDLLFLRTGYINPLNNENTQVVKSVYYRKTTFHPFDFLNVGFQEAVLFMGRDLDLYYLFSPFPYINSQDIRNTKNAPWYSPENDNCMVGGFVEFNFPGNSPFKRGFAEVLVDDWSWSNDEAGVRKVAWNTGLDVSLGRDFLAFEFAGASRYTFQRTGQYPYQYVRYDEYPELPLEYNMIGYKYGENNAALSVKYTRTFETATLGLHGEYLVFGHRDPFSPLPPDWKEHDHFRWLDDPVLQKETTVGIHGSWNVTDNITSSGVLGTTFVQNEDLVKDQNSTYPRLEFTAEYLFSITEDVVEKMKNGEFFETDFF